MSIIYDALKKTGISFKKESNSSVPAQRPKRKINLKLFLCLLLIPLGIIIGKLALSLFIKATLKDSSLLVAPQTVRKQATIYKSESLVTKPKEAIPEEDRPVENKPRLEELALPALNLNGIVSAENEILALINNRIVKKGDYIEGAQVVGVFSDRVELIFQGERFSLKVE